MTYQSCLECDSLVVGCESDAHNPSLLHMSCYDCGAAWEDYDD